MTDLGVADQRNGLDQVEAEVGQDQVEQDEVEQDQVEQDQVGVASDLNRALPVQAEEPRWRGR